MAMNRSMILPDKKLSFCQIPKTSSTAITIQLLKISSIPQKKVNRCLRSKFCNYHTLLRDRYGIKHATEGNFTLKDTFAFTFVRHPFTKFVSGYRGHFYVLRPMVRGLKTQRPPFEKAVHYVTSRPLMDIDEHFSTSWFHCDVCQIQLDFIGKVETRSQDLLFLKLTRNLDFVGWKKRIQLPKSSVLRGQGNSEDKVAQVMQTVSSQQVQQLCQYFKYDFLLFDYQYPQCKFKEQLITS